MIRLFKINQDPYSTMPIRVVISYPKWRILKSFDFLLVGVSKDLIVHINDKSMKIGIHGNFDMLIFKTLK